MTVIMPGRFETEHVFIDTQVFEQAEFNYKSKPFERLIELAQSRSIRVHLTDITINEVKSRIKKQIPDAIEALRGLRGKHEARILINVSEGFKEVFYNRIRTPEVIEVLIRQFDELCAQLNPDMIPIDGSSVNDIFDRYFNQRPPFGSGGKKHEFPDAFNIASLKNWSETRHAKIYVISGDNDFTSACREIPRLIHLASLSEFLDIVSAYLAIDRYAVAEEVLRQNTRDIEERIERDFPEIGFYLDEEGGEIHDVRVNSIRIRRQDIIDVEDVRAVYELTVEINYSADISYAMNSIEGYVVATYDETIERTLETEVEVTIDLDIQNPADYWLREVRINARDIILYA